MNTNMATLRSHEWFEPPSTSFGAAESMEALDRAKVRSAFMPGAA